ncbi:Fur family transcriptional regulator [Actinomadura algeriensis]|uniref:Fur family ferric uptake transcriptional regulator n=1 Tax=Actinomadura algeriensis TaxID=1679523 RepID=A0ABR9K235_9ACTN|nr:transcriptional repressor [Actinomadura algeriensis]MBE1536915.1 Fur family ferric uptake transcriptional regulator [Actinomadura algeriensis]
MSRKQGRTAASAAQTGRGSQRRVAIVRILGDCKDFVSAQELHALVCDRGLKVGLTTVYRALRNLDAQGRVDVVRDGGGERLYRMRSSDGHRHYLVCRTCGQSRPVEAEVVEAWADEVGETTGFDEVEHTVELTGICAGCRAPASAPWH